MWKFVYICSCVTLLAFYSCRQDSLSTLPALEKAEALMEEHPDSSLAILQNVNSPENLSDGQYATWCLLATQAKDKCYIVHTSDSLINIAVEYFERTDCLGEKALALYYQGRVLSDLECNDRAILSYLEAWNRVSSTSDYALQARIQNHLGLLYWENTLFDKALGCYRQAEKAYWVEKDTVGVGYALKDIGKTYQALDKPDSAIFYLKLAQSIAKTTESAPLYGAVLHSLGNIYESLSQDSLAIDCVMQSIPYIRSEESLYPKYLMLGFLFHKTGFPDSSFVYFQKALKSSDLLIQCTANQQLYQHSYDKEKYDKAFFYNQQYWALRDSLEHVLQPAKIVEMESLYNKEKLMNEHNQILLKKKDTLILLWILVSFILSVLIIVIYIYQRKLRKREFELEKNKKMVVQYRKELKNNQDNIEAARDLLRQRQVELEQIMEELRLNKEKAASMEAFSELEKSEILAKNAALDKSISLLRDEINNKNEKIYSLFKIRETFYSQNVSIDSVLSGIVGLKAVPEPYTDTDWAIFEVHFDMVYPDLILQLQDACPGMSTKELRICCLVKMKLKTGQIAALLGKESNTISKYKKDIHKTYFCSFGANTLDDVLACWL